MSNCDRSNARYEPTMSCEPTVGSGVDGFSTEGRFLGKTRDWLMGRNGKGSGPISRGIRFGGRRLRSTGISGLHTIKFCAETALYGAGLCGLLVGGNTLVTESGPQIRFQGQEMVYVGHEDGDIIASCEGQEVRFMQSDRGTWLTEDLSLAEDQTFLDACDVYQTKMADNPKRNLTKPVSYTPTWIPSIEFVSNEL